MVAPQIAYVVAAQGRQPAAYRRSNQCPELQSGRCTQPIQAVKPSSTRPSNRPCHGQHETSGHNQGYPRRARKGSSPLHPPPTQGPQETFLISKHLSPASRIGTKLACDAGMEEPCDKQAATHAAACTRRRQDEPTPTSAGNHQSLFINHADGLAIPH